MAQRGGCQRLHARGTSTSAGWARWRGAPAAAARRRLRWWACWPALPRQPAAALHAAGRPAGQGRQANDVPVKHLAGCLATCDGLIDRPASINAAQCMHCTSNHRWPLLEASPHTLVPAALACTLLPPRAARAAAWHSAVKEPLALTVNCSASMPQNCSPHSADGVSDAGRPWLSSDSSSDGLRTQHGPADSHSASDAPASFGRRWLLQMHTRRWGYRAR